MKMYENRDMPDNFTRKFRDFWSADRDGFKLSQFSPDSNGVEKLEKYICGNIEIQFLGAISVSKMKMFSCI